MSIRTTLLIVMILTVSWFSQQVLAKNEHLSIMDMIIGLQQSRPTQKTYDLHELIAKTSKEFGIEPLFLAALISVESSNDTCAISSVGAAGLAQLMPKTAKEVGVTNRFEPRQNIRGAARYLNYLQSLVGSNLDILTASYNYGPKARFNMHELPTETRGYIKKIGIKMEVAKDNWRDLVPQFITHHNVGTCSELII